MLKSISGPTMGYTAGFHPFVSALLTIGGMMSTAFIFSLFGEKLRHTIFIKKLKFKKIFSPKSRKFVKIWNKYGLIGVTFLTPILLSPVGGSLLAISFCKSKKKILTYMFVSSVFWSFILTYSFYYSANIIKELMRVH